MAPTLTTLAGPVSDVTRPYTTPSVTPSANALVLLVVGITGSTTDTATRLATDVSSTIGGLGPWQIVQQSNPGAVSKTAVYVWYAQAGASPTAGTITLAPGGVSPADSELVVMQVTGHNTSAGPVGTVGAFTTTVNPSLTLTAAPATGDLTVNFSVSRNDPNGAIAGAGFTLDINVFHANPSASTAVGHRSGSTSTTVPFDGLNTVHSSLLAFNLATAPAGGGTTYAISGTVAATSSTTGAVTRLARTLAVAGTVAALSATSGAVTRPGVARSVSGTVAAVSGSSGAVTRPTRTLAVTGTVAAVSATSGSVSVVGGAATYPVSGTVVATSTTSGAVTARYKVAGTAAAISGTSGNVTILRAPVVWQVTGTTAAASGTNGSVTLRAMVAGTVAAVSGASGSVVVRSPEDGGPVPNPVLTLTRPASTMALTIAAPTLILTMPQSRLELDVSDYTVGDTAPALSGTVNADLTGATVELHIRKPDGTIVTKAATVTAAATGAWSYDWAAGEIDQAGRWVAEAQVTYSSTAVQTFAESTKGAPVGFNVRDELA